MRMAQAREAVPQLKDESRSEWKKRVFDYKRQEEAKHGKGKGKGVPKGRPVLAGGSERSDLCGSVLAGWSSKLSSCP